MFFKADTFAHQYFCV